MIKKNFLTIINIHFEDEALLIDLDTNKVVMQGDYYHNKILDKIDGFVKGLEYAGYEVNISTEHGTHEDFVVGEEGQLWKML